MASGQCLDLFGSHRHEAALDLCPPLLQRPCPQPGLPWSRRCSWEPRTEVIHFPAQNHQAINEGSQLIWKEQSFCKVWLHEVEHSRLCCQRRASNHISINTFTFQATQYFCYCSEFSHEACEKHVQINFWMMLLQMALKYHLMWASSCFACISGGKISEQVPS